MADSDDEGPPARRTRGKAKTRANPEGSDNDDPPAPKRTKRSRAGKGGGEGEGGGSGGNDEEEEPKKKRRKPGKALKLAYRKYDGASPDDGFLIMPPPPSDPTDSAYSGRTIPTIGSVDIVRRSTRVPKQVDSFAPLYDIVLDLETQPKTSHWDIFLTKAAPLLALVNIDLNSDLVSFRDTKDRRTVSKRFELFPAANLQSWIVKRLSGPMIRYKLAIFNTIGTSIVKNSPGGRGRDYQTAPWHVWAAIIRPEVRGVVERAVFIWDSNFDETLAVKRRPDVFKAQRNFYKQLAGRSPLYINKAWRESNDEGECIRHTCEWLLHVAKHGFCEREFVLIPTL